MNVLDFVGRKGSSKRITMSTCYTHWEAKILAKTDIDSLLVGDSLAMVLYGHPTTLPATIEMMALHTAAVARGAPKKFIVGDLPFLSFRKDLLSNMTAVEKLMQAGANAVKLEGIDGQEETVKHIVQSGIPVMGHIGLTPQSFHGLGGYRVQGKTDAQKRILLDQAKRLQDCGAFALVLECVSTDIADVITKELAIPTIGIGAGSGTDGQVLVLQDLLGLNSDFKPKFVRHFLGGEDLLVNALNSYASAVVSGSFPSAEESFRES